VSQRVAVVADDLIWSTRLREQLEAAGARPLVARDRPAVGDEAVREQDFMDLRGHACAQPFPVCRLHFLRKFLRVGGCVDLLYEPVVGEDSAYAARCGYGGSKA
jgi:hypothetical protein